MKKILFLSLLIIFCLFLISCANKPNQPPTIQKVSGKDNYDIVNSSTQVFQWSANDSDGTVVG